MLYTILPMEMVFPNDEAYELEEKMYKGQLVQVRKGADGLEQIERVISTDPTVYLQDCFSPGTMLQ